MNKKIRILTSDVTNPWFNLATEDWIFRELDPNYHTLFLWRNAETVVIGRHQNPWIECKTDSMDADGVYLARRQSGGGAVFHDLGNTNFTFLSAKDGYDQKANFTIIINALKNLGIVAEHAGRNDITVDGKKVSGSAFKYAADRCFHHGTLLVNANMSKLGNYLQPHPLKLKAKGITSVKARVANLVEYKPELNHEIICQAIIDSFCDFYQQTAEVEVLEQKQLAENKHLNEYYEMMADWDWRFGKTPEFSHHMETRFDWGIIDLHLNVENALITDIQIFSDALDTKLIDAVKDSLLNKAYRLPDIFTALDTIIATNPDWQQQIGELKDWLEKEIK